MAKLFGAVMALVLAVSLASVGVVQDSASADPGHLQWSEVTIPATGADGGYVLWSGSDVGPIAVSPDGGTIFAGVYNAIANTWTLKKSIDSGYLWMDTGFADDVIPIVDIVVSPDWEDDETVRVATEDNIYQSTDRGKVFTTKNCDGVTWNTITSLDAALDEADKVTWLVGDGNDVYLDCTALNVGYEVLDVAFSPTYADDGGYTGAGQIVAVVTDGAETRVRAKYGSNDWSDNTEGKDAILKDEIDANFGSVHACIGFPNDYDAQDPTLFVGVSAPGPTIDGMGDVYVIEWDSSTLTWKITDLNVRGMAGVERTETNIWSIAVSGDADEATILAGTTELIPKGTNPDLQGDTQYLVYVGVGTDGVTTWTASDKQPTGREKATVLMGSAYVGTRGDESAFSASEDGGRSWNQRGLIDTTIGAINDVAPADGTLYMATQDTTMSLWYTTNEGATWERVYCSTLTDIEEDPNVNDCEFDMIRLADDGGIFVAENGSKEMRFSDDGSATWPKRIVAAEPITALTVVSKNILFTGGDSREVWKTINAQDTNYYWDDTVDTDFRGEVKSIVVGPGDDILVGDDNGNVYICEHYSTDFRFECVPEGCSGPGGADAVVTVAFDDDYADNDTIYAGCEPGFAIYRFIIDESDTWDDITVGTPVAGIDTTGLVVTGDGILYASDMRMNVGVARSVDPSYPMEEGGPEFEMMDTGLSAIAPGATLELLRVITGSSILFAVNTAPYPDQLITFSDTLTGKVILVAPDDGAATGDILEEAGASTGMARVLLSWEAMTGALRYEYEVALDEEFGSIAAPYPPIPIQGTVTDELLWLGTHYYWRVRAIDPLLSQWSETRSFITPLGPGAARPVLESPGAGQADVALRTVLEWSGLIDATKYELQVAKGCDWANMVVDRTGASALGPVTVYAIPSGVLEYDTSYCWRVRALSETTESPWSDSGTFTTMAEPEEDDEPEPTPMWVWAVIGITALLLAALLIAVIVLITRTRKEA